MAFKKSSGGVEDLTFGVTTERQLRRDQEVQITQINGSHIPYSATKSINQEIDRVDSRVEANLKGKEPNLGNPLVNGQVLASTVAGVRSWVDAGAGDMAKAVYDQNDNGIVDNSELVNGLTVETAVPVGAKFTDTVYDDTPVTEHIANTSNPHNTTYQNIGGTQPAPIAHNHTESQITNLDKYTQAQVDQMFLDNVFTPDTFNGAGSTGYVADPVTESGYFLRDDGTFSMAPVSPIGGVSLNMRWSSDTTATEPASGDIKVNNVDQTLATELYVSENTIPGNDVEFIWDNVHANDFIGIWEAGGEAIYYQVISEPIDNGTWFTVEVAYIAGDGGLDNNRKVETFTILDPLNKLPRGGDMGQVLSKVSATDYDTEWSDRLVYDDSDVLKDADANQPVTPSNKLATMDDIGGGGGGDTDLSNTPSATEVTVESSTGNDTSIVSATETLAGVMSASDKIKLNGLGDDTTKKNILINGDFLVWQKGISFTSSGSSPTSQILDMWGNRDVTISTPYSQVAGVAGLSTYALEITSGAGLAGVSCVVPYGVLDYSANHLMLSVWISVFSASASISLSSTDGNGNEDNFVTFGETIDMGETIGDMKRVQIAIPSGSLSALSYEHLLIQIESRYSATRKMTRAFLEVGTTVSPMQEEEDYIEVLKECQKYYYAIASDNGYASLRMYAITNGANAQRAIEIFFPETLRTVPTVFNGEEAGGVGSMGISGITQQKCRVTYTHTSSDSAYVARLARLEADARLYDWS